MKCKKKLFHACALLILLVTASGIHADCRRCGGGLNPGAAGGVCVKCGETESVSEGITGLCQVLIDLFEADSGKLGYELKERTVKVAKKCLNGSSITLNEQQEENIGRINSELNHLRGAIGGSGITHAARVDSGVSSGSAAKNNNRPLSRLLTTRDFTIIFALLGAVEVDVSHDHIYKLFFYNLRRVDLSRESYRSDYDLISLIKDKRFFIALYYSLLSEAAEKNKKHRFLLPLLDKIAVYMSDLGEIKEFRSYRAIFGLTTSSRLADLIPTTTFDVNDLSPKRYILNDFTKAMSVHPGRTVSYSYRWPEPNDNVWMLFTLTPDNTVTIFMIPGMGVLTVPLRDLEGVLDRMQRVFMPQTGMEFDTLLGISSIGLAAYQALYTEEMSFWSFAPHVCIWASIMYLNWLTRNRSGRK